jgi:SAM-dependent methyltransferase
VSPVATGAGILDAYCMERPGPQQVLDIFQGEWSSALPSASSLKTTPGHAGLFEDPRVTWADARCGGVRGRRILELGPLEGGHSYMLEQAGAAEVLAVEANVRSFLKCLCVKEIFGLTKVRFLLGDCMAFMAEDAGGWDMVFASGILYHMKDPARFLSLLPRMAPRVFLWTHYFDEPIVRGTPALAHKFGRLEEAAIDGFRYQFVEQSYKEALGWGGFCGGSAATSLWLTRGSILGLLQHLGYRTIEVSFETLDHPNGPAFGVYAADDRAA